MGDQWNIYNYGPAGTDRVEKIVLMLHGVGSNGQDLIGLAPVMAPSLPGVLFLSPDAPQSYDMAPVFMPSGYQWFSLQTRIPEFLQDGAAAAWPVLDELIGRVLDHHGLRESDLALLGFSQGTMMSLYALMHGNRDLAGVLGYSGMMLGGDVAASAHKPPVCLIHGMADDVVPFIAMEDAAARLREGGFDIDTLAVPGMGHSIDQSGIERGISFLRRVLDREG